MGSLSIVQPIAAQNRNAGEIRGTVTDPTGAIMPGVQISIQEALTGVITNVVSDAHGVYDAPSLIPGTYSVSFRMPSFKTLIRSNIELHVEAITVNASLEIGAVTQQVTVSTGTQLVQTETSDQRVTLNQEAVSELPSVGRSWYDFTALMPGTNPGAPSSFSLGGQAMGEGVGVNGQGGFLSSWQLDGGEATVAVQPDLLQTPIEAIGEINFKTNNFSAEYGNGLSVFSVITKSGTNRFHGSLFEFNQNDLYDARNFFQPQRPAVRWNMYGGTIGGPIKKDQIFFFFSYQRNPISAHATGFMTYPTAAMRNRDFSGLPATYDPATTTQLADGTYSRTLFAGKQIPLSRLDPAAQNIQQYFPAPNVPGAGVVNNYYYDLYAPQTITYYNGRADYNLSSGNRLNFSTKQMYNPVPGHSPTAPIDVTNQNIHESTAQLSEVWTVRPDAVNEFRFAFARENGVWNSSEQGKGWSQKLAIPNLTADLFPAISISGTAAPSGIGTSFKSAVDTSTRPFITDSFTLVRGRHILKFGGEFDIYRSASCWGCSTAGNFAFSGIFTTNPANPGATGLGYADFLLGLPATWSDSWTPTIGYKQHAFQAFVQDDVKLTPKLTANIGLRWVAQGGWGEQHNRFGNFDPALVNPATGTLGAISYGGQNGKTTLQATSWGGLGPRVGFAWAPGSNWSIRSAYGIFDTTNGLDGYKFSGMGLGTTISGFQNAPDNLTPFMQLSQGHSPPAYPTFPPSASFYNGTGITYVPYHPPLSYVQQWTFNIEHQFGASTMLEVGYTGTRSVHLYEKSDLNQVPAVAIAAYGAIGVNMQQYRPYPQYQSISDAAAGGWGAYNSLQITFRKKLSNDLWMNSNYTWSHALDTGTPNGWQGFPSLIQISGNPAANYGNSDVDIRHIWNGGFTYGLPFGQGKALLNRGGLVNSLVGGWQLSGLWVANSGQPFTVYWGGQNLDFSLANSWLPNRVCNGAVGNPTVQQWFNSACFVQAAPGTYGNSGRNILRGPDFANINTSLAKSFNLAFLGEQGRLQLRLDVTDVLNHPNFGPVNGTVTPPPTGAGTISSAITNRTAQIGAKISF
jgi:hypothetical protein